MLSSTFFQLPTGMNTWILFIYSNENFDKNVKLNSPNRVTKRSSYIRTPSSDYKKSKTVTFQNSFYIRACRTWNTLPISLRNLTLLSSFKRCLLDWRASCMHRKHEKRLRIGGKYSFLRFRGKRPQFCEKLSQRNKHGKSMCFI